MSDDQRESDLDETFESADARAFMAAVYGIPVELFWDRVVANVSSHVFVSNGERLSLQTSGLAPSELERRAKTGFVPGKSPLADIETDDLIAKMS